MGEENKIPEPKKKRERSRRHAPFVVGRSSESDLLLLLLGVVAGLRLALFKQRIVILVAEIHAVHPGMRHLVNRAIAVTRPLLRIRVVLVRLGVVVEGGD